MITQVYVMLWRVNESERLTAQLRQRCRVLGNMESGTCREHSCMYILAEGYHFPLIGVGVASVIFSECTSRVPVKMCVSDLIHSGLFILRTYVLWNKNRMLLAATLSTFFVSSKSTHHTKASSKYISQTVIVASLIIDSTASVLAECICSYFPLGVSRPLKASVHFHRRDQCNPGHHRVLQQLDQFPTLHTVSSPFRVPTGWVTRNIYMSKHALTDVLHRTHDAHGHTRHTELADELKPFVRCLG